MPRIAPRKHAPLVDRASGVAFVWVLLILLAAWMYPTMSRRNVGERYFTRAMLLFACDGDTLRVMSDEEGWNGACFHISYDTIPNQGDPLQLTRTVHHRCFFHEYRDGVTLTPEIEEQMRQLAGEALLKGPYASEPWAKSFRKAVTQGDYIDSAFVPSALLYLIGSLAGLGLISYAIVCEAPRRVAQARRLLRRRRPGICNTCGYDLRGLNGTLQVKCPECGSRCRACEVGDGAAR